MLPDWVTSFECIATTIRPYRKNREELIDILAFSLDECALQFPIVASGGSLDDICPFTFFASFCRNIPPIRRKHLLKSLSEELEVKACHPSTYDGLYCIEDRDARFFSYDTARQIEEIEALWALFEAAIDYAYLPHARTKADFIKAYDAVIGLRVPGKEHLPLALSWVRPRFYLNDRGETRRHAIEQGLLIEASEINALSDEKYSDLEEGNRRRLVDKHLDAEQLRAKYSEACRSGAEYCLFLESCRTGLHKNRITYDKADLFPVTLDAYIENLDPPPMVDTIKTKSLLDSYALNLDVTFEEAIARYEAVSCFQEHWNLEAPDFKMMLEQALAKHGGLLFQGYYFNPYKEILLFAAKEPEMIRSAFRLLFNDGQSLVERILRFESTTAQLFEQYRGDIVRAVPRRSSHGNFFAISIYLFLCSPNRHYLYSPSRVKALTRATGYTKTIRAADPDSVEQYQVLCDAVKEEICSHEKLLCADEFVRNEAKGLMPEGIDTPYEDSEHHLLIETLACFCKKQRG